MFLVVISIATPFGFELISENVSKILGIKQIQLIKLLLGTYSYVKFTFQSSLLESTDSTGRFTRYVSNVVLNVNMFLVVISIMTPFGFELISENVRKILGMKQIPTIPWYL